MLISDSGNNRVLPFDLVTVATRVFGDGEERLMDSLEGANARFHSPQGLDFHERTVYVTDTEARAVCEFNLTKHINC